MATNLFYYVTDEPAMSHVYNFALITLFLYQPSAGMRNHPCFHPSTSA
jgi:hypothetical protein